MDKKIVVFLSSTYYDLKDERPKAIKEIIKNHYIFSGMETFFVLPPLEQWKNIKRTIDECDFYVAILGDRYGSVTWDNYSYTELECEYAAEIGKPIIALVQKDHRRFGYWKKQPPEHREKQQAFKDNIVCKYKYYWDDVEDLVHKMFEGLFLLECENHVSGLGRPLSPAVKEERDSKSIRTHMEYSDNTMQWNKELYYHDEEYDKDDSELLSAVRAVIAETHMELHSAIYCVVKRWVIEKFKGKDIIINDFYVDDDDMLRAVDRLSKLMDKNV